MGKRLTRTGHHRTLLMVGCERFGRKVPANCTRSRHCCRCWLLLATDGDLAMLAPLTLYGGFAMFGSVLVANRGEIARRVIRSVQRMGLTAVAVHSEVDAGLPYTQEADNAVLLPAATPGGGYLDMTAVLDVAAGTGVAAVHPGYGFLAENAEFARRVTDAGLVWVGPAPETIRQMGDKIHARNLMSDAGVPVSPGTREPVAAVAPPVPPARPTPHPGMVKAASGGGGLGVRLAHGEAELRAAFGAAPSRPQ